MKKITKVFAALLMTIFCFMPLVVNAEQVMTDFEKTVADEIEVYGNVEGFEDDVEFLKSFDYSEHSQSKKRVNVYIFRGSTCGYCFKAVKYFAEQYSEYGEYFDLKTYEVWNNADNSDLLQKVASKLGIDSVNGVPFIVIGDKYWEGFTESFGEEMISKIMDEYNASKKTDIIESLDVPAESNDNVAIIVTVSLLALVIVGLLVFAKVKTGNSEE